MYLFISEVITLLGSDRRMLPLMLLFFVMLALIELAGIGLMAPYVAFIADPGSTGGSLDLVVNVFRALVEPEMLLVAMSVCLIFIFAIKSVLGIWMSYFIAKFSMKQQARLRARLMQAYQSIPYTEYLNSNSAEFTYGMQILVPRFTENLLFFGMRAISDGIIAISISMLLFFVNSSVFMVMIGVLGTFGFFYDRFFRVKATKYGTLANQSASSIVQGVNEANDGFKEIRILGREQYFFDIVRSSSIEFGRQNVKSTVITMIPRYILELILVIFVVSLVLWNVALQHDVGSSLDMIVLFTAAGLRLIPATNTMVSAIVHLRVGRDAVSRLYNILSKQSQNNNLSSQTQVKSKILFESVLFKNVGFRYSNVNHDALFDLNLKINSGESIGIIGTSGSGKTTLVDVLLGLLTPQMGEVLLNGKPLQDFIDGWQGNVAYLPQQVFLIDNTLRFNIALGDHESNIDERKLNRAIKQSRLHELVELLPLGVNTMLGERGIRLSGGQRQRVALARAFYHERDVLVMDEATSALDNETESEIVEEIQRLKGKKTMIVIAHRLTTVQYCDRIYKLENGKIVDFGTPQDMLGIN